MKSSSSQSQSLSLVSTKSEANASTFVQNTYFLIGASACAFLIFLTFMVYFVRRLIRERKGIESVDVRETSYTTDSGSILTDTTTDMSTSTTTSTAIPTEQGKFVFI
jgi:flagellar biogenesis protein FliO